MPESYLWILSGQGRELPTWDLARAGEESGTGVKLNAGGVFDRVVRALARDFYRPLRTATAFARIFPGEYYHPIASPRRVHMAIGRLKEWGRARGWVLSVGRGPGGYGLAASAEYGIRVRTTDPLSDQGRAGLRLRKLQLAIGSGPFRAREAANVIGCSQRSAQRLLAEGLRRRELAIESHSDNDCTYRFCPRAAA